MCSRDCELNAPIGNVLSVLLALQRVEVPTLMPHYAVRRLLGGVRQVRRLRHVRISTARIANDGIALRRAILRYNVMEHSKLLTQRPHSFSKHQNPSCERFPASLSASMQDAFEEHLFELRRTRYNERIQLEGIQRYEKRLAKPKPTKPWTLEGSIWAPRRKWCDSLDFYDTEECERGMFATDWERCLACGLGRFIERMDDEDAGVDGDGDGLGEIEEVAKVIWEYHDLAYVIFDYYAALGASEDFSHMQLNSFTNFVTDCQFCNKKSQFCKKTHFDQLFIQVKRDAGEPFWEFR